MADVFLLQASVFGYSSFVQFRSKDAPSTTASHVNWMCEAGAICAKPA
jgi:hypothetical protein